MNLLIEHLIEKHGMKKILEGLIEYCKKTNLPNRRKYIDLRGHLKDALCQYEIQGDSNER